MLVGAVGEVTLLNALAVVLGIEVIAAVDVWAAATVTCGVAAAVGDGVAAAGVVAAVSLAAVSVAGLTAAAVLSGFLVDGLFVTACAAAEGSFATVPAFEAVAERPVLSAFVRRLRAGFASSSPSAEASAAASVADAALVSDAGLLSDVALLSDGSAAAAVSFLFLVVFCAGGFFGCAGADDEADSESVDGAALATAALPRSAALTPTAATPVPSHVDTANFRRCGRRCAPAISGPP
ncbi:hypothetical protein MMUC44124_04510 [Mycolicibacterium mucogenicum DSM 44124]|nr:hypothetical protein MMUC44124_04510 [Mycolicibacterium mucogenicum DSM 44124]